jgi:hypothetical protein
MEITHHILPINPNQRVSEEKLKAVKELVFQFVKDEYYRRKREPRPIPLPWELDETEFTDVEMNEEILSQINIEIFNTIRVIYSRSFPPAEDVVILNRIICPDCKGSLAIGWLDLLQEAETIGLDLNVPLRIQCPHCQAQHNPNEITEQPYFSSFDIGIWLLLTIKEKSETQRLFDMIEQILGFEIGIHNEHKD